MKLLFFTTGLSPLVLFGFNDDDFPIPSFGGTWLVIPWEDPVIIPLF